MVDVNATTSNPMCSDCRGVITYTTGGASSALEDYQTGLNRGPFCDGLPCSGPASAIPESGVPDIRPFVPNRLVLSGSTATDVTNGGTMLAVVPAQPNFWMVVGVAAAVLVGGMFLFGGSRRRRMY